MCIRDRVRAIFSRYVSGEIVANLIDAGEMPALGGQSLDITCLLYTSDAADERSSVDLGGRRIIKKKSNEHRRSTVGSSKNENSTTKSDSTTEK